jgi:hypothetical protein
LSDDGWWSLFSFVPFSVAYASYLGAVAPARSYNVAVETATDLSRFSQYDALLVAPPRTGEEEHRMARDLMALLRGTPQPEMKFAHPQDPRVTGTPGIGKTTGATPSGPPG